MPRVSIILPTLDARRFLEERLTTILGQTFTDWELIAIDSYSTDGSWEMLSAAAANDPRFVLLQAPRDGIYPNWNRCLTRARGEFICVAPADDTMSPTFLSEMISALEVHPECDLAQCCLHGIDSQGAIIPGWWRLTGVARFLGEDYLRPHLRRAPYDGVLHSAMHTIYHSITQVLARRRVFEKTGPFPENFGPGGDFLWGMKVGLNCDIVHVPKFLATWRIHSAQASHNYQQTIAERERMTAMVEAALAACPGDSAAAQVPVAPLRFPYVYDRFRLAYATAPSVTARLCILIELLAQPSVAWRAALLVLSGRRRDFNKVDYTRALLRRLKLTQNFVPLAGTATAPPP